MRRITILLLLLQTSFASYFLDDKCVIDNRSLLNMWEYKIFVDRLKCGYDAITPPPQNNSAPLEVKFHLALKKFNFYSDTQEFSTYMWLVLMWNDVRLQWKPSDYDGLEHIEVTSEYLWTPSIKLVNVINDENNYEFRYFYATCVMEHTGHVHCIGEISLVVKCKTDLSDWPYDAQECHFEIAPATEEKGYKIELNGGNKAVTMLAAEYGREWDIMDYNQNVTRDSEKQVTVTFRLERHAEVLTYIMVYPSLIISALTLSALFIDLRTKVRLLVICFSLMCHLYLLPEFFYNIPGHSDNSPRILLFFRGSLLMTMILVVTSFILRYLCNPTKACPNWTIKINEYVHKSYLNFFIWSNQNHNNSDAVVIKDWIYFANIINSVWIIVFFIVYITLYIVFVPKPISITY